MIVSIILLIFILGLIIFIHELGHFFFAKKFGVHIYEFSLGMGPVLFSKKGKDGIDYNLRAIPIGGFVSMAGEVYEDDEENKIPKDKFMCNKPWYQRVIILVAGVAMNFVSAIIVLFVISLIWGGGTRLNVIDSVVEDMPMAEAGIVSGDKVLEINGYKISNWDIADIVMVMEQDAEVYNFVIEHSDGTTDNYDVTPEIVEENGQEFKRFGINIKIDTADTFIESIQYSFTKFGSIVESMMLTLYGLFTGNISLNALSGPIGMYEVVETSVSLGVANVIYLFAFLSINVGFLNILPFPAFDGGRVLFLIIEKIKGSPVNSKVENIFHLVGFALLMLLTIYVAISDIIKLF